MSIGDQSTPPKRDTNELALEARSVSKFFRGLPALSAFDLSIAPGEIHALVGENGAGKSTLIKILSGYHIPEPGSEIRIGGVSLRFGSAQASFALGARFLQQDLGLVDTSSVLDNICMSTSFPTTFGTIRRRTATRQASAALAAVGLDIDPDTPVGRLSPAEKTGVALARALRSDGQAQAKLLVLDEPTATLPEREVEHLLATVRRVATAGVGIIYVTHRLDEVFDVANNVTVLRDGSRVTTAPVEALNHASLIGLLLGSALEDLTEGDTTSQKGRRSTVLQVRDLAAPPIHNLSFELHQGEVLGIAGLTGSGRERLLSVLFGGADREGGIVTVDGTDLPPSRPDLAVKAGVGYLPPDRGALAGVMQLSATENLTLANLEPFWSFLHIRRLAEKLEAQRWFRELSVRPNDGMENPLGNFSGGNQQKILLAKWLRLSPKILLLDEPTHGVDIAAKVELHRQIIDCAQTGTGVIVATSENEELEALCHRVIVLRDGMLAAELVNQQVTADAISKQSMSASETRAG